MDWDDLRYALAVARTGSLNAAGAFLGVNQSTVGRRIAALEAALGTTLFKRSRKGLAPTDAGRTVIARATEIEVRAGSLATDLRAGEGTAAGIVRLLGNQWMIDRLLAAGLSGLLHEYPDLDLRTVAGRPRASLWRGEPGLGLWFEANAVDGAFTTRLGDVPYTTFRAKSGGEEAWVAFFDEEAPDSAFGGKAMGLRPPGQRVRFTAVDAASLREAIAAGIGQGLLPTVLGRDDPRLSEVTDEHPPIVRPLYCHLHPDVLSTQRVQAVLKVLREVFADAFQ